MAFIQTEFPGLLIYEPTVFEDARGYFYESFSQKIFAEAGIIRPFVQDNQSKSQYGTIRGLHYQMGDMAQSKLVRVLHGEVLDVVVDLRVDSPTYGKWFSIVLSAENKRQFFVPRGFAHGYSTLSPEAVFFYKCDNYYAKAAEGGVFYNDPNLAIDWQVNADAALLSEKDMILPHFGQHQGTFTLADS
jgi:dTDP-4-dehydrorhamnose 3,5-epimerase